MALPSLSVKVHQVLHARGKSVVVELVLESSAASVWVVYTGAEIGLGAVFEHQPA